MRQKKGDLKTMKYLLSLGVKFWYDKNGALHRASANGNYNQTYFVDSGPVPSHHKLSHNPIFKKMKTQKNSKIKGNHVRVSHL